MTEWMETSLGEVVHLQRGHDLPTQDRRPGSVPIVGSFGITGWHDTAKVKGPGVTIGRSGASFGTAAYVGEDYWPLNTCLYVTDFLGNDPRWVYALLHNIDFSGYNSGSAQPSLNRNFLKQIPVLLPSREEQHRIAVVLGVLDALIDQNRRLAGELEALARSMASVAPGQVALGEIARIMKSKQMRPVGPVEHYSLPAFDDAAMPEIVNGEVIQSGKQILDGPTVLVSRLNPKWRRCWMAYPCGDCAVASTEFVALKGNGVEPEELWALASAPPYWVAMRERVTGTTGSHQRVDKEAILQICVPDARLLPTPQRGAIVRAVRQVHALRQEVVDLTKTRDELLPLLMSGRVRVRDVEGLVA